MQVAVILHERLGGWSRQLRPRLSGYPVRWFESRSLADLAGMLEGLAAPVVLVDLARQPMDGLLAVELVQGRVPAARTLVLAPNDDPQLARLARECGATLVHRGFAPPPDVAALFARWIVLAHDRTETAGFSRTTFPESGAEPWAWLAAHLG